MNPQKLFLRPPWKRLLVPLLTLVITMEMTPTQRTHAIECTFINPLLTGGQDPSVAYHEGLYHLVQSTANGLTIASSPTITGLSSAEATTVYSPPGGQTYSYDLWAPELLYLDGNWVLYVAATEAPGMNASHRMVALQADTTDPQGSWTMRGEITYPDNDYWAIDGTVFEWGGDLYMVWSGWPEASEMTGDFPQNLYIAPMSDPFTLSGARVLLAQPDQPWEQTVQPLLEGPQTFIAPATNDTQQRLNIVYSADASWMPAYKLGILTLTGSDPLNREDWEKIGPVFQENPDPIAPVYGPGHNSNPIPSPDGSEWWFFYHAKSVSSPGWGDRNIRAQSFNWSADGVPLFTPPIPTSEAVENPSGESCGLITRIVVVAAETEPVEAPNSAGIFYDVGEAVVPTQGSYTVAAEVELQDTAGSYAFVSQDGGLNSNFILGSDDAHFTFTVQDGFGQNRTQAESDFELEIGQWYDVAGVYDATRDEILLYVDGALQDTEAFTVPWTALGHTIIGAARGAGQRIDIFNGEVRAVQLFNGALNEEEIIQASVGNSGE